MNTFIYTTQQTVKLLILVTVMNLGILNVSAWTGPPGPPFACPAGHQGCDGPIHVGTTNQIKSGSFWSINGLGTDGSGYFGDNLDVGGDFTASRVSIGTGVPLTYLLRVGGAAADTMTAYFDSAAAHNRIGINNASNSGVSYYTGGVERWYSAVHNPNGGNVDFSIGNAQGGVTGDKLFIDGTTNNVGIGQQPDPIHKLDVDGVISTDGSSGGLLINSRTTQDRHSMWYAQGGLTKLYGYPAPGGDIITIDTAGKVTLGGLRMAAGAGDGKVLTSDASGNATWQESDNTVGIKRYSYSNGGSGQIIAIPDTHTQCMLQSFANIESDDRGWCTLTGNSSDQWSLNIREASCTIACLSFPSYVHTSTE